MGSLPLLSSKLSFSWQSPWQQTSFSPLFRSLQTSCKGPYWPIDLQTQRSQVPVVSLHSGCILTQSAPTPFDCCYNEDRTPHPENSKYRAKVKWLYNHNTWTHTHHITQGSLTRNKNITDPFFKGQPLITRTFKIINSWTEINHALTPTTLRKKWINMPLYMRYDCYFTKLSVLMVWFGLLGFNTSGTAKVISWRWNDDDEISFLVEETGVPRGNHR